MQLIQPLLSFRDLSLHCPIDQLADLLAIDGLIELDAQLASVFLLAIGGGWNGGRGGCRDNNRLLAPRTLLRRSDKARLDFPFDAACWAQDRE